MTLPAVRRSTSAAPAANTASIVEIRSSQEFEQLAVAASAQKPPVGGPVVLDFYADWCGPCKQLTPKLERLIGASQGALRLAKINVDNLPELASALQVKSLPTVMLLHGGKLVDQFQGVLPDAQLKQFIDKAVALAGGANVGPRALEEAAALLEAGDVPGATSLYAELIQLPEQGASARAGLAMCALKDNNLEKVSENMDQFERQFENLDVQTEFVEQAMGNTTAATTPPEDVAKLMQEVANEHGLEFAANLPEANQEALPEAPAAQKEDDLSNRLAALRAR